MSNLPSTDSTLEHTTVAETESSSAFIQDDVVWMEDGNIVVAAGNDPTLLFKCHRSILAMHSEVFRVMFTMPAFNTAGKTYQGLPLVKLPDPVDDVRRLIRMLYDGSLIPYEIRARDTIQRIAGPLRLATRYSMPTLRARLVAILEGGWPATYQGWKLVRHPINTRLNGGSLIDPVCPSPLPASVIRLARDVGSASILPAAFYELYMCYPPAKQTVQGFEGGTLTVGTTAVQDNIGAAASVQEHLLSAQDLRCLIHGKMNLDAAVVNKLNDFIVASKAPSGCPSMPTSLFGNGRGYAGGKSQCEDLIQKWCTSATSDALGMSLRSPRDILERMNPKKHDASTLNGMCAACRNQFESKLTSECSQLWDRIPEFFCLQDSSG